MLLLFRRAPALRQHPEQRLVACRVLSTGNDSNKKPQQKPVAVPPAKGDDNAIMSRFKIFVPGFKALFAETMESYSLSKKNQRSRREQELIRSNVQDLKKAIPLFFAFAVPIVGNFLVLLPLSFPRIFFTSHFWSDTQKHDFVALAFSERAQSRTSLKKLITNDPDRTFEEADFSAFLQAGALDLDVMAPEHMKILAAANGINMRSWVFPASVVKSALRRKAAEIAVDDALLVLEDQLDTLTHAELCAACLRRGCDPHLPKEELLAFLQNWLKKALRGVASKVNHSEGHYKPLSVELCAPSLLLHACALPESFK